MEKHFIKKDYIDTNLCDRILLAFKETDKKSRNPSKSLSFRTDATFKDMNEELMHEYKKHIWGILKRYLEEFSWADTHLSIGDGINVQHWSPHGSYYTWHCESIGLDINLLKRHLVFMTYLNDVTDGGETEFFYQKLKIKPEKGLTLVWPTTWPWTHRGLPSHTQDKYIVTGWVSFVQPDKSENS